MLRVLAMTIAIYLGSAVICWQWWSWQVQSSLALGYLPLMAAGLSTLLTVASILYVAFLTSTPHRQIPVTAAIVLGTVCSCGLAPFLLLFYVFYLAGPLIGSP